MTRILTRPPRLPAATERVRRGLRGVRAVIGLPCGQRDDIGQRAERRVPEIRGEPPGALQDGDVADQASTSPARTVAPEIWRLSRIPFQNRMVSSSSLASSVYWRSSTM